MDLVMIFTIALNIFIILITVYLIFLYVKSDNFKIYPCYNLLILSIVIFCDNILRVIYVGDITALKYPQAILLTFLDKFLLTTITSQAFITFMGVCKTQFYFSKEKCIFLTTLFVGIIISLALSILYIVRNGLINYGTYWYTSDDIENSVRVKRISDTIFNGIFLLINIICSVTLLIFITKKKKEADLGYIENLDYGHHHTRIILMLIINSLLFIESYLIIYDKFPSDEVDLIYLITCIIILLYYTINKIIIKETMRIFCRGYYDKKYPTIKKNDSITDECDDENGNREENDSYSED
jgi:hypothetical protein